MDFQSKKTIIYWTLVLISIIIIAVFGYLFFYSKLFQRLPAAQEPTEQEKILEENLKKFSAPAETSTQPVSQEILDKFSVPVPPSGQGSAAPPGVSEDFLKKFSAPQK